MDPTEQQRPPAGNQGGAVEISAAEFSFASLLERPHNIMLAAAWELAAAAWEVFPCKWAGPAAKAPMTVNGHLNATTDPGLIKLWWTKWPRALIGAKVPDNCIVIDIDPRNNGSLEALEALTGPLPATLTVWSGRNDGGRHLYFQHPGAGPLTSTRLPKGVDLKVNGYCIMPPSIHPASRLPYRWQDENAPAAPMPTKLAELLRPAPRPPIVRSSGNASAVGLLRTVARAPEGNRNNVLYWASCRAAESGILNDQVEALINAAVTAGETETKARRTVASARRTTS